VAEAYGEDIMYGDVRRRSYRDDSFEDCMWFASSSHCINQCNCYII